MKFLLIVSLSAAVLGFGNDATAKEWSTPEALRAFGAPGDTVRDPAIMEKRKSSTTNAGKSKKQPPTEASTGSNATNYSTTAVAPTLDKSLEDFKSIIVNAYSHPDRERIRALVYPKSLACLSAEPKYEQYLLQAETMQAIPSDAKISVETVAATAALPYRGFKFPLRPTHVVRMEFGKKVSSDGSTTTQIAEKHIARVNDRWYLIMPCPTPEGLGRLREMGLLD